MPQVTQELLDFIKTRNAETLAWIAVDPKKRFATTSPEEAEFWAEREIYTVEDWQRDDMINTIWDLYKDTYGYRPRHLNLNAMTYEELDEIYSRLVDDAKAVWKEEEERDYANLVDFYKGIARTIQCMGLSSIKEGIQYMLAEDIRMMRDGYGSIDYLLWEYNLGYEDRKRIASTYLKDYV